MEHSEISARIARARELAVDDPTAAGRLYDELARERAAEHPGEAAGYALRAAELLERVGDEDGARVRLVEAAYLAGLSDAALHRRILERLRGLYLVDGATEGRLRGLRVACRGLAERLRAAGERRAASRTAELAWWSEHQLVKRRDGFLKRFAYGVWRLTAGYGERPLRLVVSALVIVYLFGMLYIAGNFLTLGGGGVPVIINHSVYNLLGYFGISLAAFFGDGFMYAGNALGWVLISLEAVLGWLITLTLVTVLIRRLKN